MLTVTALMVVLLLLILALREDVDEPGELRDPSASTGAAAQPGQASDRHDGA